MTGPTHDRSDSRYGVDLPVDVPVDLAAVVDGSASPEQTAELRGEQLVWQTLLYQTSAHLGDLAGYPHDRLCRAALETAAEHARAAEKLLCALGDVLDTAQSAARRDQSVEHLRQRVQRGQHALQQAD